MKEIMTNQMEQTNFQKLLQYFVCHLERFDSESNSNGSTYNAKDKHQLFDDIVIQKISSKDIKKAGQGYKGQRIQNQIKDWCSYNCGKICITCQHSQGGGYKSVANYLHWYGTGVDICAKWNNQDIESLYIIDKDFNNNDNNKQVIQITELENVDIVSKFLNSFIDALSYNRNNKVSKYEQILDKNYNLIFTGAPGTGKTYLAKRLASYIITNNCCDFNNLSEDEKIKFNDQCEFVQFHPSYDYTDFVEGLRPTTKDKQGTIVFERKDGVFKSFCAKAAIAEKEDTEKPENEKRKFVFVIDEINRGEISKIFGELFFSIDPGYRGEFDDQKNDNKVKTQYQNLIDADDTLRENENDANYYPFKKGFYVPKNVYVIGTMNDIDRSVESMDFAFRRRFSFVDITADESSNMVFTSNNINDKHKLLEKMYRLNNMLISDQIGLSDSYQIGGAYFLKYKKYQDFEKLWQYHLRGVLFEYFRGLPQKEIDDKMKELKKAYDGQEVSQKKGNDNVEQEIS